MLSVPEGAKAQCPAGFPAQQLYSGTLGERSCQASAVTRQMPCMEWDLRSQPNDALFCELEGSSSAKQVLSINVHLMTVHGCSSSQEGRQADHTGPVRPGQSQEHTQRPRPGEPALIIQGTECSICTNMFCGRDTVACGLAYTHQRKDPVGCCQSWTCSAGQNRAPICSPPSWRGQPFSASSSTRSPPSHSHSPMRRELAGDGQPRSAKPPWTLTSELACLLHGPASASAKVADAMLQCQPHATLQLERDLHPVHIKCSRLHRVLLKQQPHMAHFWAFAL